MGIAIETEVGQDSLIGRALELLGSNVPQEAVASALGVTPSYVTQLLSDEDFSQAVTKLKFEVLSKHTARDETYDELEDLLLARMKKALPLLIRPNDINNALKTVNAAKRRGVDSKESIIANQNIVSITMPIQIVQDFTTNVHNQVVKTGDEDLITIQSGDLRSQVEGAMNSLTSPEEPPLLEAPADAGIDLLDDAANIILSEL